MTCQIDPIELFYHLLYKDSKWEILKKSEMKNNAFLYALSPIYQYIYEKLRETISQSSHTTLTIDNRFLKRWVCNDLSIRLLPLVNRICVLEMHSSNQRGYLTSESSQNKFDEFVNKLSETDNITMLIKKYVVFKNILENILNNYLSSNMKFFNHLINDWNKKLDALLPTSQYLRLKKVISSGDTHNLGNNVKILYFVNKKKDTFKVVYKPRCLKIDIAYENFIKWFNFNSITLQLLEQNILSFEDHGWCEFIEYLPCKTKNSLHLFYRRAGILLAILYLLGGTDIHMENMIAHRDHPVIIDLECLLKPLFSRWKRKQENDYPTVTDSLFLPYKHLVNEDYKGIDLSALGASKDQDTPYKIMLWNNMGTNKMHAERKSIKTEGSNNRPYVKNHFHSPLDYESDVIIGFDVAYRLFLKHKDFLTNKKSPLLKFKGLKTRVLFRSTADYAKLLHESYHPKLLYSLNDYKNHLNWLKQITKYFPSYKFLINSEIHQLMQGDIPFYSCKTNEKKVFDGYDKKNDILIKKTGWDILQKLLVHILSEKDLSTQKRIIMNSFQAARMNQSLIDTSDIYVSTPNKKTNLDNYKTLHRNYSFKMLNEYILNYLYDIKVEQDTSIYWPTINVEQETTWNPKFTDLDLYSGISGIGLVFAYASKIYKKTHYKTVAQKSFKTIENAFENVKYLNSDEFNGPFASLGGFSGIGGILYTLYHFHALSINDATKTLINAIATFSDNLIENDKALDIIGGVSGMLLALYKISPLLKTELYKRLAKKCVAHLLAKYPNPRELPLTLQEKENKPIKPLIGFSHGTSGIILALANYYCHFPDSNVKKWIHDALLYEDENFLSSSLNWRDFRNKINMKKGENNNLSEPSSMLAWCNGAPGVLLTRYLLLNSKTNLAINIPRNIISTIANNIQSERGICLCHGTIGNDIIFHNLIGFKNKERMKLYYKINDQIISSLQNNNGIVGLMTGIAGLCLWLMNNKPLMKTLYLG